MGSGNTSQAFSTGSVIHERLHGRPPGRRDVNDEPVTGKEEEAKVTPIPLVWMSADKPQSVTPGPVATLRLRFDVTMRQAPGLDLGAEGGRENQDFSAAQLLDGRTVRIRPISPSDGEALVHFHEGLTNETTRLPFFIPHPHLTPGRPNASR